MGSRPFWRALEGVSRLVSSSLETEGVLRAICRSAAEVLAVPWVRLWLAEEGGKALRLAETFGPVSLDQHRDIPQVERIPLSGNMVGEIQATGRPTYRPDVQSDPSWSNPELARRLGWRAALGHPIWVEGELAGVLVILSTEADALGPEWEEPLGLFCNLAGAALRNARAHGQVKRLGARMARLQELGRQVAASLELKEVLDAIARAAVELLGGERSQVFLLEEGTDLLRSAATYGPIPGSSPEPPPLRLGEGIGGEVALRGEPEVVADLLSDRRFKRPGWAAEHGLRSYIAVPILAGAKTLGFVNCFSCNPGHFSQEDVGFLSALAEQAALAIENAQAYARARRMGERLEALESLCRQVAGSLEVQKVLDSAVRAACELLGGVCSRIYLLDEESGLLRTMAQSGELAHTRAREFPFPPRGLHGVLFRTGEPLVVRDVQEDERTYNKEWAREHGLHSYIAVPLFQEGKVRGVLNCFGRAPGQFADDDLPLLRGLADMANAALGNAELFEQVKRQRDSFSGLVAAARSIAEEVELSRVLERIAEESMRLMGADRCRVIRWSPEAGRPITLFSRGLSAEYMEEYEKIGTYWAAREEYRAGRPWVFPDAEEDPRGEAMRSLFRREGIRAYAGFPLLYKGEFIGSLTFYFDRPRHLLPEEVALGQAFAEQAAIALRTAELYQKAREEARRAEGALEDLRKAQAQVIRSEKLASIGRLAAGAAHEILNPLNIIGMYAQWLLRDPGGAKVREALPIVLRQVGRIQKITNDLRSFSRESRPVVSEFEFNELVRETVALMDYDLKLENIQVDLDLDPGLGLLAGDRDQLAQVLVNLLTNARDAMPEGGRLRVRTRAEPWEGEEGIFLEIADTGAGMSEEVLGRIFEPFFTTKPEDRGTGLGLPVCYGIVTAHGGAIQVASREGEGTTVTVHLPLRRLMAGGGEGEPGESGGRPGGEGPRGIALALP